MHLYVLLLYIMSILHSSNKGWFISHEELINTLYKCVENEKVIKPYKITNALFKITYPFKKLDVKHNLKRKSKDLDINIENFKELKHAIGHVKEVYGVLRIEIHHFFKSVPIQSSQMKNNEAIELAKKVYDESGKACIRNAIGENKDEAKHITINDHKYLFPSNCKFYCKDVADIEHYLIDIKYDLIVLDPPWWNKYIRRKKAKTDHGYDMMYNHDFNEIPVEKLLNDGGLVVVWCTNSVQHLQALQNTIFPKWNVHFIAKWYWLKVTRSGDPVCGFSEPPGKQPFEQIIFGCRNPQQITKPEDGKLVVSVPSALHSHKPPLIELLQPYLPENPECLELFARYLLPNWTSWGLEAVRFQHESLYESI